MHASETTISAREENPSIALVISLLSHRIFVIGYSAGSFRKPKIKRTLKRA